MSSRGPTGGLFMSIFRFLWILENFVILRSPELKNSGAFWLTKFLVGKPKKHKNNENQ